MSSRNASEGCGRFYACNCEPWVLGLAVGTVSTGAGLLSFVPESPLVSTTQVFKLGTKGTLVWVKTFRGYSKSFRGAHYLTLSIPMRPVLQRVCRQLAQVPQSPIPPRKGRHAFSPSWILVGSVALGGKGSICKTG